MTTLHYSKALIRFIKNRNDPVQRELVRKNKLDFIKFRKVTIQKTK